MDETGEPVVQIWSAILESLDEMGNEALKKGLYGLRLFPRYAKELLAMGFGSTHDRLDAFLSAWVASLNEKERKAFGTPPDYVIWVSKVFREKQDDGKIRL